LRRCLAARAFSQRLEPPVLRVAAIFMKLKKILFGWQTGVAENNAWNAVFWCNHDQPRPVSRLGDDERYWKESAKMLATLVHGLRGTPYIYQGE